MGLLQRYFFGTNMGLDFEKVMVSWVEIYPLRRVTVSHPAIYSKDLKGKPQVTKIPPQIYPLEGIFLWYPRSQDPRNLEPWGLSPTITTFFFLKSQAKILILRLNFCCAQLHYFAKIYIELCKRKFSCRMNSLAKNTKVTLRHWMKNAKKYH